MLSSSPSSPSPSSSVTLQQVLVSSLAWWCAFVAGRVGGHLYVALGVVAVVVLGGALRARTLRARCFGGTAREIVVDVVVGVVVGAASIVATHATYPAVAGAVPSLAREVAQLYALAGVAPSTMPATLLVVAAEELLWRGAAAAALAAHGRSGLVVAASSTALYAAAQSGAGSAWLVVAAVGLGALWAALTAMRGGRIVAALVAHALWTLVVLGAWPLVR